MNLLACQQAFRDTITAGDGYGEPLSTGMEIYRNAYRGRLLSALEQSFERTRRWVGEEAFNAAACHFILTNPPTGWTLDDYGVDFPAVLAGLFGDDPEVAELAWLEWHLQQAFAARDQPTLDPAGLSQAGLGDEDWGGLRFAMAAGFAAMPVTSQCGALWEALAGDEATGVVPVFESGILLVWRAGVSPCWRMATAKEHGALVRLAEGETFGAVAESNSPEELGAWFAQWLGEGIFSAALI